MQRQLFHAANFASMEPRTKRTNLFYAKANGCGRKTTAADGFATIPSDAAPNAPQACPGLTRMNLNYDNLSAGRLCAARQQIAIPRLNKNGGKHHKSSKTRFYSKGVFFYFVEIFKKKILRHVQAGKLLSHKLRIIYFALGKLEKR